MFAYLAMDWTNSSLYVLSLWDTMGFGFSAMHMVAPTISTTTNNESTATKLLCNAIYVCLYGVYVSTEFLCLIFWSGFGFGFGFVCLHGYISWMSQTSFIYIYIHTHKIHIWLIAQLGIKLRLEKIS